MAQKFDRKEGISAMDQQSSPVNLTIADRDKFLDIVFSLQPSATKLFLFLLVNHKCGDIINYTVFQIMAKTGITRPVDAFNDLTKAGLIDRKTNGRNGSKYRLLTDWIDIKNAA